MLAGLLLSTAFLTVSIHKKLQDAALLHLNMLYGQTLLGVSVLLPLVFHRFWGFGLWSGCVALVLPGI